MNEDLYELYKTDPDFKHYCDEWCRNHNLSVFEIFNFNILREYAKWLEEKKK